MIRIADLLDNRGIVAPFAVVNPIVLKVGVSLCWLLRLGVETG